MTMLDTDDLATAEFFPATRQSALRRLEAFVPRMGRSYAETRNSDFGPEDRSNIRRFTEGRFNTEGRLDETAAPLVDDWNGKAGGMPEVTPPACGKKTILLLHEDDCGWDSLGLEGFDLTAVAGITVTDDRSPFGASELAKTFAIGAVEDALNRADDGLPVGAVKLASPMSLIDLAEETGAEQVIYPYAPVGPVRDRLDAARAAWAEAGLSSGAILRDEDRTAWPHATRGFFAFKEQIPALIAAR